MIHWNPDPELISLFGTVPIRYYGLLWLVGLALAYLIVQRQYRDRRIAIEKFEPLFFYCFIGILVGARLGHCLFYQPDYYLNHVAEMLLPVKFLPDGGWRWTGYEGLASHGGTLGLIVALWLYCRKTKIYYMDVLDMIAVATPITACCIRLANLMNSEIIGRPTDVPWAFVFERVDNIPRHPAQLYEALAYFIFFIGMIWLYRRGMKRSMAEAGITPNECASNGVRTDFSQKKPASQSKQLLSYLGSGYRQGFFFGLCLTESFTFRVFIEFLKENQVSFEDGMTFNMGQWLSVPFVLIGLYFMFIYGRKKA